MLRLSNSVRTTHNGDGAVVLDIHHGRMFTFNPTGSRILELINTGVEEREIALTLAREFFADPRMAEADVGEFLTLLRRHALVET
jgi:hypothetical protein